MSQTTYNNMEHSRNAIRRYTKALLILLSLFSLHIVEVSSNKKDACGPHGVCSCGQSESLNIYLVNCTERNLTDVPQNIPDFTKYLDLSHNRIVNIGKDAFSNLRRLQFLSLTANVIQEVDKDSFRNLSDLWVLWMVKNKIQKLHKDTFRNLPYLGIVGLTDNGIQTLDKEIFNDLEGLDILDLSHNRIGNLDKDTFTNLWALRNLDLSGNLIQNLHGDTFRNVRNLDTLRLSDNKIESIENYTFANLWNLHGLFLSRNMIQKLNKDAFKNLSNLRYLDVSNNRLNFLPSYFFNNGINSLQELFLHGNKLVYLPANVFYGLPSLTVLSLFHNDIQALDADSLAGTGGGNIYLFGNNLLSLSNASFNNEKITEIHLYGNNITQINKTAFTGVSSTTNVYLDCYRVHELQPNVKITCVTPTFVPNLSVHELIGKALKDEGFRCNSTGRGYQCSPCPRGTYGYSGECISFPPGGFYQDQIGSTSFHDRSKQCPNGTYVKDGEGKSTLDCIVCPDGTNKTIFAGYRACFCSEKYARADRFGPCQICLEEGVNCSRKDFKTIQTGFYWSWNFIGANITNYKKFVKNLNVENETFDSSTKYVGEMPQAFPCPRPMNCHNSQGDLEVQCSEGYKGWLCSKCKEKFYSVLNYCMPCPKSAWLYTELAVIIIFCVIIYAFFYRLYKKVKNRRNRLFLNIIISRGKIVLGFYQVVGEFFASIHDVNWAKALKFIGDFVSFIELNFFRMVVRPKCFHEKLQLNPKVEFLIGLVFPCALILSSFILYWIIMARHKFKTRFTSTTETITIYARKLKSKLLASVIVLLFITYPPICTTVFQLYPRACETFCLDTKNTTCKILLRSDYDIQCKDLKSYHAPVYISTAVYVVGFPVVLFLLLRNKAKSLLSHGYSKPLFAVNQEILDDQHNILDDTLSNRTNPIWMDFLCENYKPQFWYWEIIELTRKVTQTVLITLLGWENKFTVLLTIGISVLYLTLHARYMPMKSTFEQRLQMFSLTAILANVLVAAMDVPEEYGDEMSAAIIILNLLVISIVAAEVFLGLFIRLKHVAVHETIFKFVMYCKNTVLNFCRGRYGSDE